MELNITKFFNEARPSCYSASAVEIGNDAGRITWENAVDAAEEYNLLDDDAKRNAFRKFAADFGAWSEEEIAAWTDAELNALLIQFISGDMREGGFDSGATWEEYEEAAQAGRVSSRLFRGDDGQVFFDLGD